MLKHQIQNTGVKKRIITVTEFAGAPKPVANQKFFRFMMTKLQVKYNFKKEELLNKPIHCCLNLSIQIYWNH